MSPLVVGLGQPLGGDDRVGLVIADRLLSEGVPAIAITDASALVDLLVAAERAILIDAVVGAGLPGAVIEMSGEELASRAAGVPVSTHGLSIAGAVAIASMLGGAAEVRLIGVSIEPPDHLTTALSPEVLAAVPRVLARVRALCATIMD